MSKEIFDENIIKALTKIRTPIIGKGGIKFYFRDKARKETGFEHIAKKSHRLKVRDIESVESILKHPILVRKDPNNPTYKNYYGSRHGNDNVKLIKIVTWVPYRESTTEYIMTIYPTKKIK